MFRSIRWTFTIAFAAAVLATAPDEARADGPDCTEDYQSCIAEAGLLDSPYQEIADVECAAELTGCIARKLRFW